MHSSFDMIHQGTTMQVLESKSICGTWLTRITIWSNLLVQTLVNDWQTDMIICNTFHIWVSTISNVMYLSFDMIPQGTTMQTRLTHITIWSNLLVQTLLKYWQNGYVYIQYHSYLSIYKYWCNAYILSYNFWKDYYAMIASRKSMNDLLDAW